MNCTKSTPFSPTQGGPARHNAHVSAPKHFGKLLTHLRKVRRLTQAQLAKDAGVSITTIQTGEANAECQWRNSTTDDVMFALEDKVPFTAAERRDYMLAAGMTPEAYESLQARLRPVIDAAGLVRSLTQPQNSESFIFDTVRQLIAEHGEHTTGRMIYSLAVGLGTQPQKPLARLDHGDGVKTLHDPHPAPTPTGQQKRRNA